MDSVQTRTAILDEGAVQRKITRMALEVAEQNAGEKVAHCIAEELKKLSSLQIRLISIQLIKRGLKDVTLEPSIDLKDKIIIIVDDVANTGKTMFYALKPFLDSSPKKIQTLVLVERSHKEFPIQTDYTGLSIATTLQDHIVVETEGKTITGAWLQ